MARGPGKPPRKPASAGRRLPLAVTSPTAPQAGMEGMRGRCVVRPPRPAVQSPLGARSVPGLGRHRPSRPPSRPSPSPGGSVRLPAGLTDIRAAVFRRWHWRIPVANRDAAPEPEENIGTQLRPDGVIHARKTATQRQGRAPILVGLYHVPLSVRFPDCPPSRTGSQHRQATQDIARRDMRTQEPRRKLARQDQRQMGGCRRRTPTGAVG